MKVLHGHTTNIYLWKYDKLLIFERTTYTPNSCASTFGRPNLSNSWK